MSALRIPTALAALLLLTLAGRAEAGGFGRKGGSSKSSGSSSSSSNSSGSNSGTHAASPVGSGSAPASNGSYSAYGYSGTGGYAAGYGYGYGYAPGPAFAWYGVRPYGYGWGWQPYYLGPSVSTQAATRPSDLSSTFLIGALGTRNGVGLDLRFSTEGRRFGIEFDALTFALPNPDAPKEPSATVPKMQAHATWSVLTSRHGRLRLEGGASAVFAPDVTYIGPQVGLSGQLALIGPLGFDAAVRWTPIPASIVDADAGLGLHFGNFALRGGWRWLRMDDRRVNEDGGLAIVTGPSVTLGLVF